MNDPEADAEEMVGLVCPVRNPGPFAFARLIVTDPRPDLFCLNCGSELIPGHRRMTASEIRAEYERLWGHPIRSVVGVLTPGELQ
jgi:hypothetical protein